jgi:hypothetical protein
MDVPRPDPRLTRECVAPAPSDSMPSTGHAREQDPHDDLQPARPRARRTPLACPRWQAEAFAIANRPPLQRPRAVRSLPAGPSSLYAARTGVKDHRLGGPASGSPPSGFGSGCPCDRCRRADRSTSRDGLALRCAPCRRQEVQNRTEPDRTIYRPTTNGRSSGMGPRRYPLDGAPLAMCETVERRREAGAPCEPCP